MKYIKELIVGNQQKYINITEAIEHINEYYDTNTNYIIKVLEGIYEETIILPENTTIRGISASNVIIKFPILNNNDDDDDKYLITCNNNTTLKNITINLDSNNDVIGIYSQNKNNIYLSNIVFKNDNSMSKSKIICAFIHGGVKHLFENINIDLNMAFGFYMDYI